MNLSTSGAPRLRFPARGAWVPVGLALLALLLVGVFWRGGTMEGEALSFVTATALLALHYALTRKLPDLLLAVGGAALFLQFYNRILGPFLVHRLNGYYPDFGYQDIPRQQLPRHFLQAIELLAGDASLMLGGFVTLTLLVVGAGLGVWAGARRRLASLPPGASAPGPAGRAGLYAGFAVLANVVMFTLMIARHPPIYTFPDHRAWYYPLPALALLLFGLVAGLNALLPLLGRRPVQGLLAVIVLGNLASLPHHRDRMLGGPWFGQVHPQSERLKTYLHDDVETPMLASNFRDLGALIRRDRAAAARK